MKLTARKLVCAVIAVLPTCSTASAVVEVRLRESVEMQRPVVRLNDVAVTAADDFVQEHKLAELPLMPAPAPGTQRFLSQREVADLLAAHGVDLRSVKFTGAGQVAITSKGDGWKAPPSTTIPDSPAAMNRHAAILAGQAVPARQEGAAPRRSKHLHVNLIPLIVRYLDGKTSDAAAWRVDCKLTDKHLEQLAAATSPLSVQGGKPPWSGRQRFVLEFDTKAGPVQLPVYAEVTATSRPVVVATEPLARGEVITAAHLELRPVENLAGISDRRVPLESTEDLIGMEARQAIRAGEVVFSDHVQSPLLVRRGEVISVSSHAGGIRVRTTARARQDGSKGDVVQVESLETRERFDVRVVGLREAAIFALSRQAKTEPVQRINMARRQLH